jgi:ATP-dependent RNA helicase DOB1
MPRLKKVSHNLSFHNFLFNVLVDGSVAQNEYADENMDFNALPRTKAYTVFIGADCTHEVVVPHDMEFDQLVPKTTPPAKLYEFELDEFQKQALGCIDNNKSVLVSAHTSAGKTVVAL